MLLMFYKTYLQYIYLIVPFSLTIVTFFLMLVGVTLNTLAITIYLCIIYLTWTLDKLYKVLDLILFVLVTLQKCYMVNLCIYKCEMPSLCGGLSVVKNLF